MHAFRQFSALQDQAPVMPYATPTVTCSRERESRGEVLHVEGEENMCVLENMCVHFES